MQHLTTTMIAAAALGLAAACAHAPATAPDPSPVAIGKPWPHCELPTLTPSAHAVRAGDVLTLTAGPISCDRQSLPAGRTYRLSLITRTGSVDLGHYPLDADTSLHATVTVPQVEPEQGAFLKVSGGPADLPCPEGAACAAYGISITILDA